MLNSSILPTTTCLCFLATLNRQLSTLNEKLSRAILDIETTGGSARFEKITEIAIYIHDGQKVVREYCTLINPEKAIPYFITRLTGIDNDMVADSPKFFEVAKEIVELTECTIIVAHNAAFDYSFIKEANINPFGYNFHRNLLCTVRLSRQIIPGYSSYSLGQALSGSCALIIPPVIVLRADAFATVQLFDILLKNDIEGFISKALTGDPIALKLPPNLSKKKRWRRYPKKLKESIIFITRKEKLFTSAKAITSASGCSIIFLRRTHNKGNQNEEPEVCRTSALS